MCYNGCKHVKALSDTEKSKAISEKRRDNKNRILRSGERQRKDGRYIMGHSNITMTLNDYAHTTFASARAETERMIA